MKQNTLSWICLALSLISLILLNIATFTNQIWQYEAIFFFFELAFAVISVKLICGGEEI